MKMKVRERKWRTAEGIRRALVVDLMHGAIRRRVKHPGPPEEARRWGVLALASMVEGKPLPPFEPEEVTPDATNPKSRATLAEVWRDFEETILRRQRPNTQRLRAQQWRWIAPHVGCLPLWRLTTHELDAAATRLLVDGGLGARTVRETVKFAVRLVRYAVDLGWIDREPRTPRIKVPDSDLPVWTLEQAETIRAHLPELESVMFLVMVRTGLRAGELRGVQWNDVEVDRIRVERQLADDNTIAPPKHGHKRTVFLPSDAAAVIAGLSRRGLFVFAAEGGLVPSRQHLGRAIATACRVAVVRQGGSHAARRSFATGAAALGIPTKLIGEQLGHRQVSTTDTYIKRIGGEALDVFEQLATGTRRPKNWHKAPRRSRKR